MTDTTGPEGITAILLQLAGLTEKLAALDERQVGDTRQLQDRVASLAALASDLKAAMARQEQALAALDRQVAGLAAQAGHAPTGDRDRPAYQPPAAPRFWKPGGHARDGSVARLRAWVEDVYRPGHGHLAASLGDCWDQHPLCLYILDWLSELWSVLYLAPARTAGTLAGQAEWHTRLLPAAAGQLARETRGCPHRAAGHRTQAGVRP